MDRLETKSLGALIDEYFTSDMKVKANPSQENLERRQALKTILDREIGASWGAITILVFQLEQQLQLCWNAQEEVMRYRNRDVAKMSYADLQALGFAAITAQETNAQRCRLVREIDKVLGESDRTYLEKTYV